VGLTRWRTGVAVTVAVLTGFFGLLDASSCEPSQARPPALSEQPVYPSYVTLPTVTAEPKFAAAVDSAYAHGLRVWIESDLVSRWKQGPQQFNAAVEAIAALAARPGVVGIKIADELGDRDGLDRSQIMRFLHDSRAALHANAPGTLVLIDIIGYPLGCAPGIPKVRKHTAACEQAQAEMHPALTLSGLDGIIRSGYVDVVDLATNMADPAVYRSWGISRTSAEQAAFAEAHRLGWDSRVRLQTRKALAFPTQQVPDAATAAAMVSDFVDVPTRMGVRAVDIWTFSQIYDGRLVHLTDPGLKPNVLWDQLLARHRRGDVLFTHYSPTYGYGPSLEADMTAIASVFTDVFCAAGTG
jgi:hypothetical protein